MISNRSMGRLACACLLVVVSTALTVACKEQVARIQEQTFDVQESPVNVRPCEYDVELTFPEQHFNQLKGKVDVYLKFVKPDKSRERSVNIFSQLLSNCCGESDPADPSNSIVLQKDPKFDLTNVELVTGESISKIRAGHSNQANVKAIFVHPTMPFISIKLKRNLLSGHPYGRLSIAYEAREFDGAKMDAGLIYGGENKEFRAITLEPGQVHKLFPCFDSPSLRAQIQLTVNRLAANDELVSLAHQVPAKASSQSDDELQQTRFLGTKSHVPLHTFKLALGEWPYKYMNDEASVAVMEPLGHAGEASHTLEVATSARIWMEGLFRGKHWVVPRLSLVPTPASERSNISASLGLVFINHELMLINETLSSPERKIEAAIVATRAVAYQWLGQKLTAKTRDDLWIIEGLAFHLVLQTLRGIRSNYKVDQYVRSEYRRSAFLHELIARPTDISRLPVELEADAPTSLVRMMRATQIIDMLRFGVCRDFDHFNHAFLSLFDEQKTSSIDLDTLVEKFATAEYPKDKLTTLIKRRLEAGGEPWIHIDTTATYLILSKSHFYSGPVPGSLKLRLHGGKDGSRTQDIEVRLDEFEEDLSKVVVAVPGWFYSWSTNEDWIEVVAGEQLMPNYRIVYHERLLDTLRKPIETGQLTVQGRIQLVSDELDWLLHAQANLPEEHARRLAKVISLFQHEQDTDVLLEVLRAVRVHRERQKYHHLSDNFQEPLKRVHERLGKFGASTRGEPLNQQRLRAAAAMMLVESRDRPTIDEALAAFDSGLASAPGYMRGAIYAAVKEHGLPRRRESLLESLPAVTFAEERSRIESATANVEL